ncbi:MAG: GRAM domain-containing protein [Bacteroidales bacterium]|nr:GRAM domain-containing protein [Bacteroidales bacterium]
MVVDLKANELVVKASDSNYFAGGKSIDGKLILTNQRLYFKPKQEDNQSYNMEIMPTEILEILYFNTLKIIPNGLNIVLKEGRELKFKISKRNSWGKVLNKIY